MQIHLKLIHPHLQLYYSLHHFLVRRVLVWLHRTVLLRQLRHISLHSDTILTQT